MVASVYRKKMIILSTRYSRGIFCSMISTHPPCSLKRKSKTGERAISSLNLPSCSKCRVQCIARAVEHLPVTHLEIVTLAYAAMNFVTYVFWWNKPVNVNRPVRVFRKSEPMETQPQLRERVSEAQKLTWERIRKGLSLGNNI